VGKGKGEERVRMQAPLDDEETSSRGGRETRQSVLKWLASGGGLLSVREKKGWERRGMGWA
jgi:hypothetical protein